MLISEYLAWCLAQSWLLKDAVILHWLLNSDDQEQPADVLWKQCMQAVFSLGRSEVMEPG